MKYNISELFEMIETREALSKPWAKVLPNGKSFVAKDETNHDTNKYILEAYQNNAELVATISKHTFIEETRNEALHIFEQDQDITLKELLLHIIQKQLLKRKKQIKLIRATAGITIKSPSITFSCFLLFKYPERKPFRENPLASMKEGLYIASPIFQCRDNRRGSEIAEELFQDFCNIVHYMNGQKSNDISARTGVEATGHPQFDIWQDGTFHEYIQEDDELIGASHSSKLMRHIDLEDSYFHSEDNGNKFIQDLYALMHNRKDEKSLQSRILKSILWIGKSLRTESIEDAFLCAIIALEVLFSFHEKSLFQPSIGSTISESVAILVGDNASRRIEIMKEINNLYSIRSAIVHSGKMTINPYMYSSLIHYSKHSIYKLLTDKKLTTIKTTEELHAHFKFLKMMH